MDCDVAIIGAGAAGLMAAAWAVRENPGARVIVLDGAAKLGAKILVAGGGRCNVTHHEVDESAYAGSSRNAIKKVLLQFGVKDTMQFFRDLGVELKREDTGKLFPVTDDARTVLNALLYTVRNGAEGTGAEIRHPARVTAIDRLGDTPDSGFAIHVDGSSTRLTSRRVVLATGGMSLPKSGSDGFGYTLAKKLGHTITPEVFPGLVPLYIKKGHWLGALSGVTVEAALEVRACTGQRLHACIGSTLLSHFGLSGPAVLDISRYWTRANLDAQRAGQAPPTFVVNWLPGETVESLDREMMDMGRQSPFAWAIERARGRLPERLVSAIASGCGIAPGTTGATLTRDQRRRLAQSLVQMPIPVTGDRGYNFAEVTAGGVPLSELNLATMESRVCPGLHLCGEILDVDGRIGGFNFQWAWASGYVAGMAAARDLGVGTG